jgi:diacylglycerol kinase family enzyme
VQEEIQNLHKYCAIIAVGGDGTMHEVINGMMFRKDRQKVPIALIPNGTGNDLCKTIGLETINEALSYLKKGDVIKMDLNRVLMDAKDESEISQNDKMFERMRYSAINACIGFLAKVVHAAVPFKPSLG